MSSTPNASMRALLPGWRHSLIVLGYGLFLIWPAAFPGFFAGGDGPTHVIMSRHFVDQFLAGDLYPHWLSDMNAGLGSPVFYFLGPIPYYIAALFRPFVPGDPEGWHQVGLAASLAVIASGFTAYVWIKRLTNETAALVSAVVYMGMPYHLAFALYRRFAFAELWAFVLVPVLMFLTVQIARGDRFAIIRFALCYTVLIMTHVPTTLIFSAIPIGYALFVAGEGKRIKSAGRVLLALVLGAGMSAIYLLPALSTQGYVSFETLWTGRHFYGNSFLIYGPRLNAPDPGVLEALSGMAVAMVLVAGVAWLLSRNRLQVSLSREANFWIAIAVSALFLMLPLSEPVWQLIPVLQKLQFPWRFNTVLTLATTVLISIWIISLQGSHMTSGVVAVLAACAVIFGQSMPGRIQAAVLANALEATTAERVLQMLDAHDAPAPARVTLEALKIDRDIPEMRTRWASPELFEDTFAGVQAMVTLGSNSSKANIIAGEGSVIVRSWMSNNIVLQTNSSTPIELTVNQFYYPGWTARINDSESLLSVQPSRPQGLIQLGVPAGKREILLTRNAIREERAGTVISQISALVLLCLAFWLHKTKTGLMPGTRKETVLSPSDRIQQ